MNLIKVIEQIKHVIRETVGEKTLLDVQKMKMKYNKHG